MIEDCTILLFTYNRHILLKKNIKYYQFYFSKIIVLDSSDNSIILDKKIKYEYLPQTTFLKKLSIGIKKCTTKYFLIVPDDDFIIPYSVKKAIKFLKKNKDFVTVSGNYYYFEKHLNLIKYKKINTYKYKSIEDGSFYGRLESLIQGHSQMVYCIFSKKLFSNFFFAFMKFYNENKLLKLTEAIITLLCIFSGKHKYINTTWMIRDGKNNNLLPKKKLINFREEEAHIQSRIFFKKNFKFLLNIFYNLYKTNVNLVKKKKLHNMFKIYFYSIKNKSKLFKKRNYFSFLLIVPQFQIILKYFFYFFFHIFRKEIFKNKDKSFIISIEKTLF